MKILTLLVAAALAATPQAIVFDWGDVIARNDREIVVDFICKTFQFTKADFERANSEKRKAIKAGKSEIDFWLHLAKEKKISLPSDWPAAYTSTLKASVGADPEIYAIIDDKMENVEAAKKMGIDAFVFESAAQVRAELAKRGL